jgi:hypothetical protein
MNENKFVKTHNKMKLGKYLKRCTWSKVNQEFRENGYEGRYDRAFKRAFYELKKNKAFLILRLLTYTKMRCGLTTAILKMKKIS